MYGVPVMPSGVIVPPEPPGGFTAWHRVAEVVGPWSQSDRARRRVVRRDVVVLGGHDEGLGAAGAVLDVERLRVHAPW